MRIGINCGHTISGPGSGAVGIINESTHTRLVGRALTKLFTNDGTEVIDCTIDKATIARNYLSAAVTTANKYALDWFISIHFNASATHAGNGVEVHTYKGRPYNEAVEICNNISAMGFKNRGIKDGSGLYVIRKTKAKAILIEVCFCDNEFDTALYLEHGHEKIAKAIYKAIKADTDRNKAPNNETYIMGDSVATEEQLRNFLLKNNPNAVNYTDLPGLYLEEGRKEGVRGDAAFCMACKETGYFKFGGDVDPSQNNYCGLGTIGNGVAGTSFVSKRMGVRANIQHLKAYGSKAPLVNECIDPRFHLVSRGCVLTFEQLSGKWAVPGFNTKVYSSLKEAMDAKDTYGHDITKMLTKALNIKC